MTIRDIDAVTFKYWTDVFPYGYGASSVELSERELHVEQRDAAEDGHEDVGNKESTCRRGDALHLNTTTLRLLRMRCSHCNYLHK